MNIPTTAKELAEYIPTDADGIRRKAANMNGQLNFDRQTDCLSSEQLRVLLPTYLNGRGQMVGEKRIRIMSLLQQLEGNGTATVGQPNGTERTNGTPTKTQTERQPKAIEPVRAPQQKPTKSNLEKVVSLLPILPLPTLGLAASYGVYHFAVQFAPPIIAIFEAIGFELVYIGLSTIKDVPEKYRKRLVGVSVGAVSVSVVYNSISAWLVMNPSLFVNIAIHWQIIVSVTHGLPIALLGFFVADLISSLRNYQRK